MTWACLGIPPKVPPCDATGETEKSAERHVKETQHGTMTVPHRPEAS